MGTFMFCVLALTYNAQLHSPQSNHSFPASWSSFLASEHEDELLAEWSRMVQRHPQAIVSAMDAPIRSVKKSSRPPALTLMWWRLTRLLFSAEALPIDAAGGKHRGHRLTIARRYVNNFMLSSHVQLPLARLAKSTTALRCAEVGDGHFLRQFLNKWCAHKYSIDIKDPKADVLMDLTSPNFSLPGVSRGHYHAIVMNEVLEHILQPVRALTTLAQLLAPGGVLITTTPYLMGYHANPNDYFRYTPSSMRAMLTQAGLRPMALQAYGNWLAVTGYSAGFAADEVSPELMDAPDWRERASRPFELTVATVSYRP